MISLFLYGTLRHTPLLSIVLARPIEALKVDAAMLRDYRAIAVPKQPYPLLISHSGGEVHGLLVRGLDAEDIARLNFYEGGFDFDLCAVEVTIVPESGPESELKTCEVYIPNGVQGMEGPVWELERWRHAWGLLSEIAAREAMGYYQQISAAVLAQKFPMIRARAAAQIAAQTSAPVMRRSANMQAASVEMLMQEINYSGFFLSKTVELRHPTFAGGQSEKLRREVFFATDATIVLPYDPVRDVVLLVEQFRMGPFGRGDPHPWSLEPVAGRIDAGETPEQAAYRETAEEAGIDLISLEKIASYYPTPGYSTEYFYSFIGICDLPDTAIQIGGLVSEGEDIQTHILPFKQAMDLLTTGEAENGPLVLSLLWLARERPRLRGQS